MQQAAELLRSSPHLKGQPTRSKALHGGQAALQMGSISCNGHARACARMACCPCVSCYTKDPCEEPKAPTSVHQQTQLPVLGKAKWKRTASLNA